eukprot:Opistho-2@1001
MNAFTQTGFPPSFTSIWSRRFFAMLYSSNLRAAHGIQSYTSPPTERPPFARRLTARKTPKGGFKASCRAATIFERSATQGLKASCLLGRINGIRLSAGSSRRIVPR